MTVHILPALGHVNCACHNCGSKPARLRLDTYNHPGFGLTRLTRDGEEVVLGFDKDGPVVADFDGQFSHGRRIEAIARKDPDHDWRFHYEGPMYGVVYQRHAPRTWMAVERKDGFA